MIYDGVLIPNSELGHVQRAKHGGDAESFAAYSAMEREDLSWKDWTERLQWYYSYIEFLFPPTSSSSAEGCPSTRRGSCRC